MATLRCNVGGGEPGEPDARIADARIPDAPPDGMPDAMPISAAHLGDLCQRPATGGGPTICTQYNLTCTFYSPDGTSQNNGFCSLPCPGFGDPFAPCNRDYDKVGLPVCANVAPEVHLCVIRCGVDNALPDDCPSGLVCRDVNMNGTSDTCLPPAP
jgi:hypothetical protein